MPDQGQCVSVSLADVSNGNSLPSIDWRLWFAPDPFDDDPPLSCDDERAQFLHDLYRDEGAVR
jgi:hypothetical protein